MKNPPKYRKRSRKTRNAPKRPFEAGTCRIFSYLYRIGSINWGVLNLKYDVKFTVKSYALEHTLAIYANA